MEEWKDIQDFPGYQVSNKGRVKGFHGILKQGVRKKDQRSIVSLAKNNKQHSQYVHRLVAEAFLPKIKDQLTVNHKDGNKLNNCVENLEWISLADNIRHAHKVGLYHRPIRCVLTDSNGISTEYNSTREASIAIGRCNQYVYTVGLIRHKPLFSKDGMSYIVELV